MDLGSVRHVLFLQYISLSKSGFTLFIQSLSIISERLVKGIKDKEKNRIAILNAIFLSSTHISELNHNKSCSEIEMGLHTATLKTLMGHINLEATNNHY